jgi:uridine kinase
MRPFVVGIAGGSGAGKSTLARELAVALAAALVVQLDWYYRDLSHLPPEQRAEWNFDHPDALDWELLRGQIGALRRGEAVLRPAYDFGAHARLAEPVEIQPQPVAIVEGILALHDARLRELLDLKIFVDAPRELRLGRRTLRDVVERGRTKGSVLLQFERTVEPMHGLYVAPSRDFADLHADGAGSIDNTLRAILARFRGRAGDQ